jgi:ADP-ribose pyrophosphatase YjhB (NUDIX family)
MEKSTEFDIRSYPRWLIAGAGAVVFKEGRLLLVKRFKDPDKGAWSIPGGGVELGETVDEAARREVMEECSIEIEIEKLLDVADLVITDDGGRIRYHYIFIDYLARYVSGECKPESPDAPCGWFTPEEAAALRLTDTLRALLEKQGIIKKK